MFIHLQPLCSSSPEMEKDLISGWLFVYFNLDSCSYKWTIFYCTLHSHCTFYCPFAPQNSIFEHLCFGMWLMLTSTAILLLLEWLSLCPDENFGEFPHCYAVIHRIQAVSQTHKRCFTTRATGKIPTGKNNHTWHCVISQPFCLDSNEIQWRTNGNPTILHVSLFRSQQHARVCQNTKFCNKSQRS